jgi:hypothetical protein
MYMAVETMTKEEVRQDEGMDPEAQLQAGDDWKKTFERTVEGKYRSRLEIWKVEELSALEERQAAMIQDALAKHFEEEEAKRKPLDRDQIQLLLSQEYVTMKVKVPEADKMLEFTLQELPQDVEKKFYDRFKNKVVERAADIASLSQDSMDAPLAEKIQRTLLMTEEGLMVMADTTALILNYGKPEELRQVDITAEWVSKRLSSSRQWSILLAQSHINRLRDFFSQVFQSGLDATRMTSPLTAQQLLRQQVK